VSSAKQVKEMPRESYNMETWELVTDGIHLEWSMSAIIYTSFVVNLKRSSSVTSAYDRLSVHRFSFTSYHWRLICSSCSRRYQTTMASVHFESAAFEFVVYPTYCPVRNARTHVELGQRKDTCT
jgi:hypothetical protein